MSLRTCSSAPFLWSHTLVVIYGTNHRFFIFLIVLTYMLAFQLGGILKKAWKILLRVFGPFLSGCACCWARPSHLVRSYEVLLPYSKLVSRSSGHVIGSGGKYSSVFSIPYQVHWLKKIWSLHCICFQRKPEDNNYNWAQIVCDPCWYSWYCCRQISPLVVAVPSHFASNFWRHKGKLYCIVLSFYLPICLRIEHGGESSFWCQKSSTARIRTLT